MQLLTINDFDVEVKKWDRDKNVVIVNVKICGVVEIRGFQVRFATSRFTQRSEWLVSPPSLPLKKRGRKTTYFWVTEIKNKDLWDQLKKKIINTVDVYTRSSLFR